MWETILVIVIILLVGIGAFLIYNLASPPKIVIENYNSDIFSSPSSVSDKSSCSNHTDCQIPMEYAVQSNCPYASLCYQGECVVVCPMWEHSPDLNESINYQVECSTNPDCDCSIWDTQDKYACLCLDNTCVSLITDVIKQDVGNVEPDDEINYKTEVINQEQENYIINFKYPEIVYSDQAKQDSVNQAVLQIVNTEVNSFKDSVSEFDLSDMDLPNLTSSLNADYEIHYFDQDLISLSWQIYYYAAGAAHGFSYWQTLNYDIVNQKQIGLVDLFVPDSSYIEALSYMAETEFDEVFAQDEWFREGVEPDITNFQSFVITADSLVFLFDDYQVAAYVYGPQKLEIKYSDMGALINKNNYLEDLK